MTNKRIFEYIVEELEQGDVYFKIEFIDIEDNEVTYQKIVECEIDTVYNVVFMESKNSYNILWLNCIEDYEILKLTRYQKSKQRIV